MADTIIAVKGQVNYDPKRLLDDSRMNPTFTRIVRIFLNESVKKGFSPVVHEAYRTPSRSAALAERHSKGGPPAAHISMHNYGLAVDIKLRTAHGNEVSYGDKNSPFTFKNWLDFIKIGENLGLINGKNHNDTDHYEYHPSWSRTNWISAKRHAKPVYDSVSGSESDKLKAVWRSAGIS